MRRTVIGAGLLFFSAALVAVAANDGYGDDGYGNDGYGSSSVEENGGRDPETVTNEVKLSDTVTQKTVTTTRFDSDGDGIFDEEDTHPVINDYFIVEDANRNGIVDRYEQ